MNLKLNDISYKRVNLKILNSNEFRYFMDFLLFIFNKI